MEVRGTMDLQQTKELFAMLEELGIENPSCDSLDELYEWAKCELLKRPAIEMLRRELGDEFAQWYKKRRQAHGDEWWLPERWHFLGGMAIRNLLRERGFGELYFGIENLDDIYIGLVEAAMNPLFV